MFALRFLAYWTSLSATRGYLNQCLAFSFISLGNLLAFIYFTNALGLIPNLVLLLLLNFILYLLLAIRLKLLTRKVKQSYKKGDYPSKAFFSLTAVLIAGLFLIIPGIASFVLALLIVILERPLGKLFSHLFKIDWKDVYEYLKLGKSVDD
ncbi:MAG: FxsA family protein [Spirochaetaceae bacterium]|nr:FxsA family protein [Spirochaetaceae bacterium]